MLTKLEFKIAEFGFVFLLLLGCYFWIGHQAVEDYKDQEAVAQATADKAQRERYDALQASYEALKSKREDNARTITKQVEKVVEKQVYKNICIDEEGLGIINSAITGRK